MSKCTHPAWCSFPSYVSVVGGPAVAGPMRVCSSCGGRGVHSLGPSNDDYPQHAADMAMAREIASHERVAKTMRGRSR